MSESTTKCPVSKCPACGHALIDEPTTQDTPAPEEPTMKSFRLHRQPVQDTEFAVLLALVPAMTLTLFNLMGLL